MGKTLELRPPVFTLLVELEEIEPAVWRRIEVPAELTLRTLHDILQVALGWEDSHLHLFTIDGVRYGFGDNEYDAEERDDSRVRLGDVVHRVGATFLYQYDLGDDWQHRITVEAVRRDVARDEVPRLLAGARACPPEDCGGPGGYSDMLAALADPDHEDHETWTTWTGGGFDPERFDLTARDRPLARWRAPRRVGARAGKRQRPAAAAALTLAEQSARNLAELLQKLRPEFEGVPPHIFETAGELLMRHARRAPDSFLGVRKRAIWVAAALHAAFMLQPRWSFSPPPHMTLEELASIFDVSTASISGRSAELRRDHTRPALPWTVLPPHRRR